MLQYGSPDILQTAWPALIVLSLFLIALVAVARYLDSRESRAKVAFEAGKEGGDAKESPHCND